MSALERKRAYTLEYMNERYANDPEFRERKKEAARRRYREKTEELKEYQRERKKRLSQDAAWVEKNNRKRLESRYRRRAADPVGAKLGRLAHAARSRARSGGYESDVTPQFLIDMWHEQQGLCAVTKVPMGLNFGEVRPPPDSVSIDRIDSSRGYYKDNVRLVTYIYNIARQDRTDDAVLEFARALVAASSGAHGGASIGPS